MNPDSIGGPDFGAVMSTQVVVHLPALDLPKSRLKALLDHFGEIKVGKINCGDQSLGLFRQAEREGTR